MSTHNICFNGEIKATDKEIVNFILSFFCFVASDPWLASSGRNIRFDESFVKAIKQYCCFIGDLASKVSFCTFLWDSGMEGTLLMGIA